MMRYRLTPRVINAAISVLDREKRTEGNTQATRVDQGDRRTSNIARTIITTFRLSVPTPISARV